MTVDGVTSNYTQGIESLIYWFPTVSSNHTLNANFAEDVTSGGTPYWWLAQNGYTDNFENAAIEDSDGDGLLNGEEYIAATNPNDSNSIVAVDNIALASNGIGLSFSTSTNRKYTVQYTSDLRSPQNWQTLEQRIPTNETTTVVDTNPVNFRVYRVIVEKQ